MKRFVLVLLSMVFAFSVCACISGVLAAEEKVVYLSGKGNDENDGKSASAPKLTLSAAIKEIGKNDGTIVLCGNYEIKKEQGKFDSYKGTIKLTSKYGGERHNASLTVNDDITFGGKTILENIKLYFPEAKKIFCGGNDTVFGEGIDVKYAGYTAPSIYGGKNSTVSGQQGSAFSLREFSLQIDSGIWNGVYCGNYRKTASNPMGTATGNTTLTINGGTFKTSVSATGQENRSRVATLNINGGEFLCSVYGISEPCTNFGDVISYEGNIEINIKGGTFTGDICVAAREAETQFFGECNINLISGDFSRVNLIRGAEGTAFYSSGKAVATLNLGEGIDLNAEQTGNIEFTNNIADFADPSVSYHNGWYYYAYAKDYKGKTALWLRRAANFSDISSARPQLVWSEADTPTNMKSLWAPQLVSLEGKFYIYATCAYEEGDSNTVPRKPTVFVSNNATDPMDGFAYFGPMENIDPDIRSYLSPRFFDWNGKTYMINGGFFRAEDRVPGSKHYQSLFVTEMESPTRFAGKAYQIAKSDKSWEVSNDGKVKILEGPFAYTGASDGKLYILYAANETARDNYCTGLLRFDGKPTDDITNASLWYKFPEPIHKRNPSYGIHSPGATVLVPSPDGKELWMIYHAKLTSGKYTYEGRILFAQPFEVDANGIPVASTPKPKNTVFSYTKNTMPLAERVEGFNSIEKYVPPASSGDGNTDPSDTGIAADTANTSADNAASNKDKKLNQTVLVAGICAAIFAVAGVAIAVVLVKNKKKK